MTSNMHLYIIFLLTLNCCMLYSQDSLFFYYEKAHQGGDQEAAIADMTRIVSKHPTDSGYYWLAKLKMLRLYDPKGALADATKSLQLNPNQAGAHYERAGALERLSDFEPYYWPPQCARDLDSAERDYSRAIDFDTSVAQYADDYYGRAGVRHKLQHFQ